MANTANKGRSPLNAEPITSSKDDSTKRILSSRRPSSSSNVHEQAPFDQFSVQIQELCRSIWPAPEITTPSRTLPAGFSGHLRRLLQRKKQATAGLPPPPERFNVEYLECGKYDKITSVVVPSSDAGPPLRLVLRTPISGCELQLRRDVAAIRYMRKFTSIPVAGILASDFSTDNPLRQPYALQSQIAGYNLRQVYSDLLHEHVFTVAREVGKILLALQRVNSRVPGLIQQVSDLEQSFAIQPFHIKLDAIIDQGLKYKDGERWNPDQHDRLYGTTIDMLITQFGRWRAHELLKNPLKIVSQNYYHRLVEVAQAMNKLGIFDSNENCLCHLNLSAGNIMVDIPPADGSLTISGLVGWESAIFAPKFVGCAPPSWLWADVRDGGASAPPNPYGQKIKRIFEETVGEEYLRYAYEPRYQLARRLFSFALNGIQRDEDIVAVDRFLQEWKTFHDNLVLVQRDRGTASKGSVISSLNPSTQDGDISPLTDLPEGKEDTGKDTASYFRRISYKPPTEQDLETEFTDELRVRFGKRQSLAWSKV